MSTTLASQTEGQQRLWRLPTSARRLLLIAPPFLFAGLTVLHPRPDENTQALMDASTWFVGYHLIQLALVLLVTISVFLLADDFGRASSWPVCLGMGTFMVFFSAYDTLAGIGTGLAMRGARGLPESQQDAVFEIVHTWPALEPWAVVLTLVGTGGWIVALGYLTLTARAAGAPRSEWIFLGLAVLFLMLGHPAPFGTLAFGSLCAAAIIHVRRAPRVAGAELPDRSPPARTE